jgi:hypothetical protein
MGAETKRLLVWLSPGGTDTNEEIVQVHRLKHRPRVVWQPHESHLEIFELSDTLGGQR